MKGGNILFVQNTKYTHFYGDKPFQVCCLQYIYNKYVCRIRSVKWCRALLDVTYIFPPVEHVEPVNPKGFCFFTTC